MKITIVSILCFCLLGLGDLGLADDTQARIQAKIGIKLLVGGKIRRAKAVEKRLKAGDGFQIYVQPKFDTAYIYIVYSDQNTVMRLNTSEQTTIKERGQIKIPARENLGKEQTQNKSVEELVYEFDGNSSKEYVTIICSPVKISEIDKFFDAPEITYDKWRALEKEFIEKSQIELEETVDAPLSIAGGLRGIDPFWGYLPLFSGKSLVIKKYEFSIKKQ